MREIYYCGKISRHQTQKILSTKDGLLELHTIEDAMIYGSTQGIFYRAYEIRDDIASYALRLAELMKSENRNGLATKLYFKAFDQAWQRDLSHQLYSSSPRRTDPVDVLGVYAKARAHLFEIGDYKGVERLKKANTERRYYTYMERKCIKRCDNNSFINRVDGVLDRANLPIVD
ncbi:MAG: hypothetical protein SNG02_00335 [Rikenellaceae bacterium]